MEKVVKKCTPETVAILIGFGAGSGVIVSEDGLVLTAAHVITGEDLTGKGGARMSRASPARIVLPDGKHVKGKTLGVNSDTDVGMVQITDKGPNDGKWPFLPVAKSADAEEGGVGGLARPSRRPEDRPSAGGPARPHRGQHQATSFVPTARWSAAIPAGPCSISTATWSAFTAASG